ncbi:hypothetical protein pb186bvf_019939 [Paramecium bursaria]
MLFILINIVLGKQSYNLKYQCLCNEIITLSDCITTGCYWNYATSTCGTIGCEYYGLQSQCDSMPDCAWNNSNLCGNFTQCSSYTVNDSNLCFYKGSRYQGCQPPAIITKNIVCYNFAPVPVVYYPECSELTRLTCNNFQDDGQQCTWDFLQKRCVPFSFKACSDAFNKALCPPDKCFWDSNNRCRDKLCTDITIQSYCDYIYDLDQMGFQICSWNVYQQIHAQELLQEHLDQTILVFVNNVRDMQKY